MGFDNGLLQGLPLFVAAVLVLNATPGVDLLLTVTRTAEAGRRAGAMAALGIACGCAVHALAAAFGLAALLAVSAQAFLVVKWLGAGYLAWLGVGMLFSAGRTRTPAPMRPRAVASAAADFRRGALTNLLNPKVALFMLAFLPQFIPAQAAHKTALFLLLGAWFVVQSLLWLLAVVLLTSRLARVPALARYVRWLRGAAGLLFIALAARLAGAGVEGDG